ncbi:MAG TPA: hypothetical protein VHJ83_01170, partial [Micromonosporaceae bacterium]|nr:hypothetical protein [Micromonosporaceae bacterium]
MPVIASGEQDLLGQALSLLSDLLPEEFRLERQSSEPAGHVLPPGDAVWLLRTNDLYTKLLVQAKRSLAPRDVDQVLGGLPDLIRQELGQSTVLVVAPWLSPRTRERLEERDYSYADLTGNVRLRTRRPPVYLRLHGSDQDPTPPERSLPQLHGPK